LKHSAIRVLPPGYHTAGIFDVTRNTRLLLVLNAGGLALFVITAIAFSACMFFLRPLQAGAALAVNIDNLQEGLIYFLGFLLVNAAMVILHEGVHGLAFSVFTRSRPRFGFRWYLAYAAAPGWYIPRAQYLVTALAPLVLISSLGIYAFSFLPAGWLLPVLMLTILNASGSVGDLWVTAWLLRQARECLALDEGEKVTLFTKNTL
jgi:hypothetical protein